MQALKHRLFGLTLLALLATAAYKGYLAFAAF